MPFVYVMSYTKHTWQTQAVRATRARPLAPGAGCAASTCVPTSVEPTSTYGSFCAGRRCFWLGIAPHGAQTTPPSRPRCGVAGARINCRSATHKQVGQGRAAARALWTWPSRAKLPPMNLPAECAVACAAASCTASCLTFCSFLLRGARCAFAPVCMTPRLLWAARWGCGSLRWVGRAESGRAAERWESGRNGEGWPGRRWRGRGRSAASAERQWLSHDSSQASSTIQESAV